MNFFTRLFSTQDTLSEADYKRSEGLLLADAIFGMGMGALAGGPFLVAFALALGASNYQIGMLATIALLSQLMQLPGLLLTNLVRKRRAITTLLAAVSRLLWIPIILIPIVFVKQGATFLLLCILMASLVGAALGPSWNSLLRDIIPPRSMGRVFARRLAFGTALALALTLAGGLFVDWWQNHVPGAPLLGYSIIFSVGLVLGMAGCVALARVPEPTMTLSSDDSFFDQLSAPVKDRNFKRLLIFIGMWSFAINMAGPFFVIYMLQRIHISLTTVTLLTVLNQLTNLAFLRVWGRMADRFSSKSVFAVAGPMFLVSILAWSFTTMPERYVLTIPLLCAIHILSGAALAGVNITSSSMALKLSVPEKTHSYMTVFTLVAAACGACGPFIGGLLADFFADRELALSLSWNAPTHQLSVYAINLKALDFVFLATFFCGLLAFRRLARVREEGEVPEGQIVADLVDQIVLPFKMVSSIDGLRNRVSRSVYSVLLAKKRHKKTSPTDTGENAK